MEIMSVSLMTIVAGPLITVVIIMRKTEIK